MTQKALGPFMQWRRGHIDAAEVGRWRRSPSAIDAATTCSHILVVIEKLSNVNLLIFPCWAPGKLEQTSSYYNCYVTCEGSHEDSCHAMVWCQNSIGYGWYRWSGNRPAPFAFLWLAYACFALFIAGRAPLRRYGLWYVI
jgi:hypothetical protein